MWVVLRYNKNELNFLKQDFKKALGDTPSIFLPKFRYQKLVRNKLKFLEKNILDDYLICYHAKFNKVNSLNEIRFIKGLEYFLSGYNQNQKEIVQFINHCKVFENEKGYLTSSFFKSMITTKARFVSGPLTNMIFEIIEKQKNKIKILMGDIVTIIPDKKNYLYQPI